LSIKIFLVLIFFRKSFIFGSKKGVDKMNLISTAEAAKRKGVTRQGLINAMNRGEIDGHKVSPRSLVIVANKKFEAWQPNLIRQAARLKGKTTKKARK
jgi:hypothetical protein